MWWNILPSAGIVLVALNVPLIVERPILWLFNGKAYNRRCLTCREANLVLRDKRLGEGNIYNLKGLENVPDA